MAIRIHPLRDRFAVGRHTSEDRRERDVVLEQGAATILDVNFAGLAFMRLARQIHKADALHHLKHPRSHGPGIHAQCATDTPRNSLQEFEPGQSMASRFDRNGLQLYACAANQIIASEFQSAEIGMTKTNHHPPNPSIPDQQIGTTS